MIDVIVGARPNFVKAASIVRAFECFGWSQGKQYQLIHTGQHTDVEMSSVFFEQLGLPEPNHNLGISGGSQAEQVGDIMKAYEKHLSIKKPRLVLVVGDVNSTLACAVTAKKMNVGIAHVEAGLRSHDWSMPEEVNRVLTDSISDLFFTTTPQASKNLLFAGASEDDIFFVGNTMIDTLIYQLPKIRPPKIPYLRKKGYFLLTIHRPANTQNIDSLTEVVSVICKTSPNTPIILPLHPRLKPQSNVIKNCGENLRLVSPQPYLEFIHLVKNSLGVITDSGGVTEECTFLNIPCVTLRSNTERPETVNLGTNVLVGSDYNLLASHMTHIATRPWKATSIPEKWDGLAGRRIVTVLSKRLGLAN